MTSPRAEIFYCQPNTDRLSFLPVELFKQPLELLVVHVFLLRDDLHVHLLLVQLLLVVLELDQGVLLLPLDREKCLMNTQFKLGLT